MRNKELDLCRVICTVYIVGILHLMGYSPNHTWFSDYTMIYIERFTQISLACFTFISGFFLGKKDISTWGDVLEFYKHRLGRFYFLYFIAITLIYVLTLFTNNCWFPSFLHYILSVFGLSSFVTFQPATFWFIEMLIVFYILTPLILINKRKVIRCSIICTAYILFILFYISDNFDYRIFLYFPIYIIGLFTPRFFLELMYKYKIIFALIGLLILFILNVSFSYKIQGVNNYISVFALLNAIVGVFTLISISTIITSFKLIYDNKFNVLVSWLSYLSMAAYLFHRHIYFIFKQIEYSFTNIYFNCLAFLVVIIISYYIQSAYDFVYGKMQKG